MSSEAKKIIGLKEESIGSGVDRYRFLLVDGEKVMAEYKSVRDRLILTTTRIISIDVQGLRGKKAEFFILPYSKISAFAVETAGTFDLDAELKIWSSGLGKLQFEFIKGTDIKKIAQLIGSKVS